MMGLGDEREKKGGLRGLFAALGGHKIVKRISKEEYEARQRGNN